MKRTLAGVLLFVGMSYPASAHAKFIPIIWGSGEKVVPVGELPSPIKEEIRRELKHNVELGFMYNSFHIYWCDMWTWNGSFVLFDGNKYWKLDEAQCIRLLGKQGYESLSRPLRYLFPSGLTGIVAIVVFGIVWAWVFPSKEKRVQRLLANADYQEALKLHTDKMGTAAAWNEEAQRAALADAVSHLSAQGIAPYEAEANMQLILEVLAQRQAAEVEQNVAALVGHAVKSEERGELDKAIEAYERLAAIAQRKEDYDQAMERVQALREKQAAAPEAGQDALQ